MEGLRFTRFFPYPPVPAPDPVVPDHLAGPALRFAINAAIQTRDRRERQRRLARLTLVHPAVDVPGIARFYLRQKSGQERRIGGRLLRIIACEECDATLRRGVPGVSDWHDGSGDYIQPRQGAEAKAAARAEQESKHLLLHGSG